MTDKELLDMIADHKMRITVHDDELWIDNTIQAYGDDMRQALRVAIAQAAEIGKQKE
jgi:hypothetical protein